MIPQKTKVKELLLFCVVEIKTLNHKILVEFRNIGKAISRWVQENINV
jgi:hypothetical protein